MFFLTFIKNYSEHLYQCYSVQSYFFWSLNFFFWKILFLFNSNLIQSLLNFFLSVYCYVFCWIFFYFKFFIFYFPLYIRYWYSKYFYHYHSILKYYPYDIISDWNSTTLLLIQWLLHFLVYKLHLWWSFKLAISTLKNSILILLFNLQLLSKISFIFYLNIFMLVSNNYWISIRFFFIFIFFNSLTA